MSKKDHARDPQSLYHAELLRFLDSMLRCTYPVRKFLRILNRTRTCKKNIRHESETIDYLIGQEQSYANPDQSNP